MYESVYESVYERVCMSGQRSRRGDFTCKRKLIMRGQGRGGGVTSQLV